MKRQPKYIQFPLEMLQNVYEDRYKGIDDIISYGMYNYSRLCIIKKDDAIFNLIYRNYQDEIPVDLKKHFLDGEFFGLDEDYRGFDTSGTLDKVLNDEFIEVSDVCNDPFIMEQVNDFYRGCLTLKFLGIKSSDVMLVSQRYIYDEYRKEGQTMASMNLDTLWSYRDNEKTSSEMEQFAVASALRSMIGKSDYKLISYGMLFVRMFGYDSPAKVPESLPITIKEQFNRYNSGNKRYHRRKMVKLMENNWHYCTYSDGDRGNYFSSKLSLDELALVSLKSSSKYKEEEKQRAKQRAKQKALDTIKREREEPRLPF